MKKIAYLFLASVLLSSCALTKPVQETSNNTRESVLVSVLRFQKSAEMRALFLQGYNTASRILEEKTRISGGSRPRAIIMDLDETVLDNSPSDVYHIRNNKRFSDFIFLPNPMYGPWINAATKNQEGSTPTERMINALGDSECHRLKIVVQKQGFGNREMKNVKLNLEYRV